MEDVINYCGGIVGDINQLIVGGPMMGRAQYSFDVPVTKTTSGILFVENDKLETLRERACIRCGKCIVACPQGREPWLMANLAQNQHFDELPSYGLNDCMECGSCTYVCPSKRDIVHWIKYGKAMAAHQKR